MLKPEISLAKIVITKGLQSDLLLLTQRVRFENQSWDEKEQEALDIGKSDSDLYIIPRESEIFTEIERELQIPLGNITIADIRLNRYKPDQYMGRHYDSGYPDHNTILIRLDDPTGDLPRLKINEVLVDEFEACGYVLPYKTYHEVVRGKKYRYSLAVWYK